MAYDLEFEKPLAELEKRIVSLQRKGDRLKPDELRQLHEAERELRRRTEEIYKNLTSWETVQVARHKDRPYSSDYIQLMCEDFFELHGDHSFSDDHAIMAGLAKLDGATVMFVCHQKGRDMKEKQFRNLGMPHPEGYRKAGRVMEQAEKFGIPVVSLIDTPGAFLALGDEERGHGGDRRRRQRRRLSYQCGRPYLDARTQHLHRCYAGSLGLHPLARQGLRAPGSRGHAHQREGAKGA